MTNEKKSEFKPSRHAPKARRTKTFLNPSHAEVSDWVCSPESQIPATYQESFLSKFYHAHDHLLKLGAFERDLSDRAVEIFFQFTLTCDDLNIVVKI